MIPLLSGSFQQPNSSRILARPGAVVVASAILLAAIPAAAPVREGEWSLRGGNAAFERLAAETSGLSMRWSPWACETENRNSLSDLNNVQRHHHANSRKIFRRFRTTPLPIVMLNPLRRIDGSRTNDPHSLTKREIQTRTAKLGQAVEQIASANNC